MILVLSFDYYEQGTDPVIDWLIHLNANFIKITIQDFLRKDIPFHIDNNEGRIYVNNTDFTDIINVIWYRRLEADISIPELPKTKANEQVLFELQHEVEVVVDFLKNILSDRIWMPHFNSINTEKPQQIYLASKYDILTPKSIITNNKNSVYKLLETINKNIEDKRNLIMKPIRHSGYFVDKEYTYSIYTKKITKNELNNLPDNFVLTMFQECIESHYEIRTFYLDGTFYSTAIILSEQTENIDIKLSFQTDIINWLPYKLPSDIEQKLDNFMRLLNLNTASLDILYSKDNQYYLLEINPVGQYNAPSFRCNYFIEEKIAKWLINQDTTA